MKFDKIKFVSAGFGPPSDMYWIDFDKKLMFVTNDFPKLLKPGKSQDISLSEEDILKLDRKLQRLHFENWNHEYNDNHILDGEQWEVEVYYHDGTEVNYYGSNAYPDNFDSLRRIFKPLENIYLY
ncbi:hypothetical protein [Companilactobacillus heilongjiangensis]|uniref:Uncharacterized protein n=1 Tax=Companilactobacillus heilongjiangensis TaxID=1074467 RepID=A0A0K2LEP5_9LACO|nr:hypothetical protein [Companilactobacillus heilongjiangensis]ALB29767.1 hypothetical protein JP39_10620 [Companilactobacillus heilongjiangensis]